MSPVSSQPFLSTASVPAVFEHGVGRLGVVVVAFHDAGALDGELAYAAVGDRVALRVHYLDAPAVAWDAYRADLVDVADAEVDAARADGFREAVVRVVFVAREDAAPSRYEARRHGLRADVHEPPLRQLVVFEVDSAVVYRVEDVLHPRHEQPYDGAFFVGHGLDYRLGVRALE